MIEKASHAGTPKMARARVSELSEGCLPDSSRVDIAGKPFELRISNLETKVSNAAGSQPTFFEWVGEPNLEPALRTEHQN